MKSVLVTKTCQFSCAFGCNGCVSRCSVRKMDYISAWCKSQRRLGGLTAIVTGCNTGIGKEIARDFYLRGAKVIMACRDLTKAESAKTEMEQNKNEHSGLLTIEKLDISDSKSVHDFAKRIDEPISILVNNAGVMCCAEGKTVDGFETHMGTNHFGHALLTLLLLPNLSRGAPARVVFVASVAHAAGQFDIDDMNFEKTPYSPMAGYCRSKAANVIFTRVLAKKLKDHNINDITVYAAHPGVIVTDIFRHWHNTMLYGTTWLFNNLAWWFLKSSKCGAQTIIYCAIDEACAEESGLYYTECAVLTPLKHCQDDEFAEKLWNHTLKSLKIEETEAFSEPRL